MKKIHSEMEAYKAPLTKVVKLASESSILTLSNGENEPYTPGDGEW